ASNLPNASAGLVCRENLLVTGDWVWLWIGSGHSVWSFQIRGQVSRSRSRRSRMWRDAGPHQGPKRQVGTTGKTFPSVITGFSDDPVIGFHTDTDVASSAIWFSVAPEGAVAAIGKRAIEKTILRVVGS